MGGRLRQIPATVIDVGACCGTCHKSQRVAEDCEVNVYGDPASPAGVEVGLQGRYLNDDQVKARCIEFMARCCRRLKTDLLAMNREKSRLEKGPLTLEVTPPTDDDAYNAWWISVYNTSALGRSRASCRGVGRGDRGPSRVPGEAPASQGGSEGPDARRAMPVDQTWAADDFRYARPVVRVPRVYIRG